jgi:hypothetical protein
MADIVYTGGAGKTSGGTDWISTLLPVVALAGLGYLAYKMLMAPGSTAQSSSGGGNLPAGNNQVNQANTPTQASHNDNSAVVPASVWTGLPGIVGPTPNWVTPSTTAQAIQEILNLPNNAVGLGGLAPGSYKVPGYDEVIRVGTGIGNLFIEAGPNTTGQGATAPRFFPMGPVITTSSSLDYDEQREVLRNLSNSGITNAWWSPVQTITQTTKPGGINSAGSFQSNIPAGTQHCAGPGPGAPQTDTWHYC